MSKIEINNEIVLMRKNVTQAQVHVVKKLTRDAYKLRQKKGTEEQKNKNHKKADRIAAQILAIKTVKKDDIIKKALENTLTLKEVLENRHARPLDKIIARVIHHKLFSQKIAEFKAKYPNFQEFLGPGRKKKAKLEHKDQKKLLKKKKISENNSVVANTEIEKSDKNSHSESDADSDDQLDIQNNTSENQKEISTDVKQNKKLKNKLKKNKNLIKKDKITSGNTENLLLDKALNEKKKENNVKVKKIKKSPSKQNEENLNEGEKESFTEVKIKDIDKNVKIISKEAIVKKFEDIIKEDAKSKITSVKKFVDILQQDSESNTKETKDQEEKVHSNKLVINIEKEVDPFFMTNDGEASYMSVASLKKNASDTEEAEDNYFDKSNRNKRKYQNNLEPNHSANKIPRIRNSDLKWSQPFKGNTKFDSNRSNTKWRNQKSNDSFDKRNEKDNFRTFNVSSKNSFTKQDQPMLEEKNEKHLHPSWEAKKKQQDILRQGFQGKKIVFDDF